MAKTNEITQFLNMIECPKAMYPIAYKHYATISLALDMHTLEGLSKIIDFLKSEGAIRHVDGKPLMPLNTLTILCNNSLDDIKERFTSMGEDKQALIEKPIRINSKSASERIAYLKSINLPYKNEAGKYDEEPFSYRLFNKKYGNLNRTDNLSSEPVLSIDAGVEKPNIVPNQEPEHEIDQTASEVSTSFVSSLEDILKNPQTIGLNDETFDRYERLSDSIRRIMKTVYGIEEVNDTITDNLIKLVTNDVTDDSLVIYNAITFGKNISEDEEQRLRSSINEELEYTGIMDINLGRAA